MLQNIRCDIYSQAPDAAALKLKNLYCELCVGFGKARQLHVSLRGGRCMSTHSVGMPLSHALPDSRQVTSLFTTNAPPARPHRAHRHEFAGQNYVDPNLGALALAQATLAEASGKGTFMQLSTNPRPEIAKVG